MGFYEFLVWLGSVGGSGMVASFLLERWSYFKALTSEGKMWASFGTMASLGVLSHVVLTYAPTSVLEAIAPYFAILASSFMAVFAGSLFHKADKQ